MPHWGLSPTLWFMQKLTVPEECIDGEGALLSGLRLTTDIGAERVDEEQDALDSPERRLPRRAPSALVEHSSAVAFDAA